MQLEEVLKIMTVIEIIMKAVCILIGIVFACIITIPAIVKAVKARKVATTAEEKAKADLQLNNAIVEFIQQAEHKFLTLDSALKKLGESAGPLKKESVMSDVRDYCEQNNIAYDKQLVSDTIDKTVEFTKTVNYKK